MADIEVGTSTDADLSFILAWLKTEDAETGEGFWCNRRIVEAHHAEGDLLILREDGKAVAFQLGALVQPGIMEVRPDCRGRGYGRMLAERRLKEAWEKDLCLLHIECTPITSRPFWERMGFTVDPLSGNDAFMVLSKRVDLDSSLPQVQVKISFFPERALYNHPRPAPLSVWQPDAVRLDDGTIELGQRVVGYKRPLAPGDLVVEIVVNGKVIFFDKAKRDRAYELGLEQQAATGAWYMDCIDMIEEAADG